MPKIDKAVTEVEQALLVNIKEISEALKASASSIDNQIRQLGRLQDLVQQFKALSTMNVGASAKIDKKTAEKVAGALDATIKTYNESNDLTKRASKTKEATRELDNLAKQISEPTPSRRRP